MITRSDKSKRKYVPISIADSLKTINRKFLYKFGKLDYTIHSKWSDIVGDFFVNHSEPQKISSILKDTSDEGEKIYDNYLHVFVTPAAALDFQHFQDKIVERINSYFGYKAIKGVKIHQHHIKGNTPSKKQKSINLIEREKNKIQIRKLTPNLSNKELEESIVKLGLSIKNEE